MSARILFLDRDGTLNRTMGHRPPNKPEEVELLDNVAPVLSRYTDEGWQLAIVTNQGGVAQGYMTEDEAHAVLQRTIDLLPVPVAAAYLCPHMPGAPVDAYAIDCPNRKPRPGFLLQALDTFSAHAQDCLLVGDSTTDRVAARAAGIPFCWADTFFERPIDRGIQTADGEWVQVREQAGKADAWLCLVALRREEEIGRLTLFPAGNPDGQALRMELDVNAAYRGLGIGPALIEAAIERAQQAGWV